MAKKNYTKAGSRRAIDAIQAKMLKLHQDGYITSKQYISLSETFARMKAKCR